MTHTAPMSKKGLVAIRVFMLDELRDTFKTLCALKKSTMNKVIVDLVEGYVEENKSLLPTEGLKQPETFKDLIRQKYFELMNSGKIGHQRLKELSFGQKPTIKERQLISQILEIDSLPED
ncbi:hypothetical protein QT972_18355 [Microcoleus sp. herbarium7]|uniref:hypothetical protein n=1 Tax=Microcoleus sp. herbarium7 TaxID=3055435 RepID=UPI002FD2D409